MTQADSLRAWWDELDDFTRRRLLRLQVNDLLPHDIATDLQTHGITVILIGVEDREDGVVERWWEQPHILLDLLLQERRTEPCL